MDQSGASPNVNSSLRISTTHSVASSALLQPSLLNQASENLYHTIVADITATSQADDFKVPRNVILLIDVSGSMAEVIPQVRQTVIQLGNALNDTDSIAIVVRYLLPTPPFTPPSHFRTSLGF